jgi:UDP-N-acetylglucosamine 4-epimerase
MFNNKLYKKPYHEIDLSNDSFLVTGGAGFIGSNLVEYLLKYNAGKVRILDNLSNGYFDNIKKFMNCSNFEFIEGDIRNLETCKNAVEGISYISHQAALGSVPRSILDPSTSNDVNISGFLNMLIAAKESLSLKKMVYAASSSTYGDSPLLPKIEGNEGNPLSPYAVTKLVNKIYGLNTVGLRYFNIYGPNQNPNNPYAAVIPLFCKSFIDGTEPTIFGDGNTSRDFTFVENAVQANIKALLNVNLTKHEVMNVACGDQISLNKLIEILQQLSGLKINAKYSSERKGDVKHSKASIDKIEKLINYIPEIKFKEGIEITYEWYAENKNI